MPYAEFCKQRGPTFDGIFNSCFWLERVIAAQTAGTVRAEPSVESEWPGLKSQPVILPT